MPSLLDSPTQQIPAAGAWGSLYASQEPAKPRQVMVAAPAAAVTKKPAAYGGGIRKKNLEMCTEALGCETGAVDKAGDGEEAEAAGCAAERKRRAREEAEEMEKRARRPLPPPLTTLAHGGSCRVRMIHERRDGRLAVYAVRTPGVEAERSGGRLRMRLFQLPLLPCGAGNAQESREAEATEKEEVKEAEEEEYGGVAKYVRGGRCMELEDAAAAARRGSKQWEPEQAAAFWVATS